MAELIDALDEKGKAISQRKTWLNIINDGDWRNVVHVWIIDSKGKLLIQQRTKKGAWDYLWDVSIGGGVSAGEKPIRSAVRELKEELDIDTEEKDLKRLGVWNVRKNLPEQNKESREFSHTYLLRKDLDIKDLTLQEGEVKKVDWKSLSDMRRQIEDDKLYKNWVPHPKKYYLEVINMIEEQK